jgi:hypothetical protein
LRAPARGGDRDIALSDRHQTKALRFLQFCLDFGARGVDAPTFVVERRPVVGVHIAEVGGGARSGEREQCNDNKLGSEHFLYSFEGCANRLIGV